MANYNYTHIYNQVYHSFQSAAVRIRAMNFIPNLIDFVSKQDKDFTIGVILFSAVITILALLFFYTRLLNEYKRAEFWKTQSEYFLKIAMDTNTHNKNIMREKYQLKKLNRILEIKNTELDSLNKKNQGIFIGDSERERIGETLAYIIRSLPDKNNSEDIIRQIVNLAEIFNIEITVEIEGEYKKKNRKRTSSYLAAIPLRKQPKRCAAPKSFSFSEDETEEDKKSDPDYRF